MSILKIIDAEKHRQDTVIFPAFQLEVEEGNAVAIHSSIEVRRILLDFISGKEFLAAGEIRVADKPVQLGEASQIRGLGILFLDDGVYERLRVKDYLIFFKRLYGSQVTLAEVYEHLQMTGDKQTRVKDLPYSKIRRLQMAKLLLQDPCLYILEEPDQNVDTETKRIFVKLIRHLKLKGNGILVLTSNMESAIIFTERIYRLDDKGLQSIDVKPETREIEDTSAEMVEEAEAEPLRFHKIPTKVNDKMLLFDPPEIDYIESHDGQSSVHIRGESFPCVFTLNDLEGKLQSFGFFRCHRSYIVNLQRVREVITWTRNSYSLRLEDSVQSEIPLSKSKMAELKSMLGLK
ncbi:LytTR family transcriptional regulator DNA-binding domain-containing protein [Alteribacillus sp. HJP-4]|uniref:LytTR family transcriptional regulator DNA-binding domain-containing protein n=1 Tax=Alteribacillus sp. HJP-4 TaxID=2775394 RepID=UPI0035CCCBAA